MIMASCDAGDALGLARRIVDDLADTEFAPAGRLSVSIGIAQGPEHAMNPRELVACAEIAMMTAKARGKNQVSPLRGAGRRASLAGGRRAATSARSPT